MERIFAFMVIMMPSLAIAEGFVVGTQVKTPNGYAKIEDTKVGDSVLSCDFSPR